MRRAVIGLLVIGTLALSSSLEPRSVHAQPADRTGAEARDARVERWLSQAARLVARGRVERALGLYRRAADRAPSDPRAPLALAALLLPTSFEGPDAVEPSAATRERAREIVERLERVESPASDPSTARALRRARLVAAAIAGDHRGAIERAALSAGLMDSDAADLLRELAALAIGRHDLEAADGALDAARRADPVDPTLVTDQAAVRLARGRATEAVLVLEETVRRRPEDLELRRDLAGALLAAGRAREALAQFAAIVAARPDDAGAELDAARAAFEAGELGRAVSLSTLALGHAEPDDPEAALVLAAAELRLGHRDAAREAFREAARRAPDDARAREGLRALPR